LDGKISNKKSNSKKVFFVQKTYKKIEVQEAKKSEDFKNQIMIFEIF